MRVQLLRRSPGRDADQYATDGAIVHPDCYKFVTERRNGSVALVTPRGPGARGAGDYHRVTMSTAPDPPPHPTGGDGDHLGLRAKAAIAAGKGVAGVSRLANLGSGSVIGGRVSLAIDADLLASLVRGRDVALISATNGKTTTTHLLATALARHGAVVSNSLGANMPAGIV